MLRRQAAGGNVLAAGQLALSSGDGGRPHCRAAGREPGGKPNGCSAVAPAVQIGFRSRYTSSVMLGRALKCPYLVTRSLDPTGTGRARWTMRWKPVLNAFAITFGDRWPTASVSWSGC